ncbi:F0F1 ATP synthase subunit delta [Vannielia litorea]|uniref:ATP synthase subunit delta n=1 Tax=Vannielia litorea TaxID=1217970 RepID=A0A1N6GQE4_9RHOB|nr:F0F1 ATP synthase subunit delta [Vannielia litorea]SIO09740.1 ATP synthase F1 subcomplex delta subunit [Vannielia litorea]
MSETASISASIAARYASALFDLAKSDKKLKALDSDAETLGAALEESDAFRELISNPVYTRAEQEAGVTAVARKMGLDGLTTSTLGLMAQNRRLFALPQLVKALKAMIAEEKGEVTAEVTSAKALTATQQKKLAETLAKKVGKDVKLEMRVDEALIGGLVVKLGSQMIDSSIRSKLSSLQNAMKEVG